MKNDFYVIPAIDLIDVKCVRLTNGDYNQRTDYAPDPLEMAKKFEGAGLTRLHLVDLEGAKAEGPKQLSVLDKITSATNLVVDFGGGIKTTDHAKIAFEAGASQLNVGSIAVKKPALFSEWLQTFGGDKLILSADFLAGKIASNGWLEQSDVGVESLIGQFLDKGLQWVMCTDIGQDGTMKGPSTAMYKQLLAQFPSLSLIASGGVRGAEDAQLMQEIGMSGCVIGKAIYADNFDLSALNFTSIKN